MSHTFYRWFKKPFFGRFVRPWRWPDSIDSSPWHAQSIPSQSGSDLSAFVAVSCAPDIKGAVLLAHPMGAIAKGFWLKHGHAELLRNAGYHVLVFDLNGFGESPSTNMEYPLDVLAAGQHLQNLYPDLPIAVIGASMGAAMSMCAMAHTKHPFKAAILESAFPTLLHFWRRYPLPKLGIQLTKIIYPAGERRMRPLHAAKHLVGDPSILLIYGDKDIYTPIQDGRLLFDALSKVTSTEFWEVNNAKHTLAYPAQPDEYSNKIIQFLNDKLATPSKGLLNQSNCF